MRRYQLAWIEDGIRYVGEAIGNSESAARQCWIDGDVTIDYAVALAEDEQRKLNGIDWVEEL